MPLSAPPLAQPSRLVVHRSTRLRCCHRHTGPNTKPRSGASLGHVLPIPNSTIIPVPSSALHPVFPFCPQSPTDVPRTAAKTETSRLFRGPVGRAKLRFGARVLWHCVPSIVTPKRVADYRTTLLSFAFFSNGRYEPFATIDRVWGQHNETSGDEL